MTNIHIHTEVPRGWCPAGNHYGRSHPWQGQEENTGQARPSRTPSMMRSWGKNLTGKAVQDIRDPPSWPRPLPHPVSSPPFLLLFLFALLLILVLPAESSPALLSLNKDQLKTLTNKSPGCWYPMKGQGLKEMLQFKPFCWHSGLFDKCVLSLHKMLMSILNILSTVRWQKKLLSIGPSAGWEKPHKYYSHICA